jgi:tetratricopeptide (TPR) repeat protein
MATRAGQVSSRRKVTKAGKGRRRRPEETGPRSGVPTLEEALDALHSDQHQAAVARFAARILADPDDEASLGNYAIALLEAGRPAEAAPRFEKLLEEQDLDSFDAANTVTSYFFLACCRLDLGDPRGSLEAAIEFLDRGNESNPVYLDGLHNTACAWGQLGFELEAEQLFSAVQELGTEAQQPEAMRLPYRGPMTRRKVIETSHRILGRKGMSRRPRNCTWPVDEK